MKRAQGDLDQAISIYKDLLKAQKRVLGEKHPRTLMILHALAQTIFEQTDYEQAEVICREALEARGVSLGREHLDTLSSMRLRLDIVRAQNRHETVKQLKD